MCVVWRTQSLLVRVSGRVSSQHGFPKPRNFTLRIWPHTLVIFDASNLCSSITTSLYAGFLLQGLCYRDMWWSRMECRIRGRSIRARKTLQKGWSMRRLVWRGKYVPYRLLFYFVPKKPKSWALFHESIMENDFLVSSKAKQSSSTVVYDTKTNEDQYTVDIRPRVFFSDPCVTWGHDWRPRSPQQSSSAQSFLYLGHPGISGVWTTENVANSLVAQLGEKSLLRCGDSGKGCV